MMDYWDQLMALDQITVVIISSAIIFVSLVLAKFFKEKSEVLSHLLFFTIVIPVIFTTFFLIAATLDINHKSVTKGPVHYHADFEIYNCGEKLDLINPTGWSNKIGTNTFHEHNDDRIHVEGPVMDYSEISLGSFFKVIGGEMAASKLVIPTTSGNVQMEDGAICNGEMGKVQVFVYKVRNNYIYQEKLSDPYNYILSPHSAVPPGDCLIIEFDKEKNRTDKICTQYEVKLQKGELTVE